MTESQPDLTDAAQLQEALDMILQRFEYPSSVSVEYEYIDGSKRSTFCIERPDETLTYELVNAGPGDDIDPELTRID